MKLNLIGAMAVTLCSLLTLMVRILPVRADRYEWREAYVPGVSLKPIGHLPARLCERCAIVDMENEDQSEARRRS